MGLKHTSNHSILIFNAHFRLENGILLGKIPKEQDNHQINQIFIQDCITKTRQRVDSSLNVINLDSDEW